MFLLWIQNRNHFSHSTVSDYNGSIKYMYVMGCPFENLRIIAQMIIYYDLLYVRSINFTSTHLSNIVVKYGKYFRDVYPVRFVKVAH